MVDEVPAGVTGPAWPLVAGSVFGPVSSEQPDLHPADAGPTYVGEFSPRLDVLTPLPWSPAALPVAPTNTASSITGTNNSDALGSRLWIMLPHMPSIWPPSARVAATPNLRRPRGQKHMHAGAPMSTPSRSITRTYISTRTVHSPARRALPWRGAGQTGDRRPSGDRGCARRRHRNGRARRDRRHRSGVELGADTPSSETERRAPAHHVRAHVHVGAGPRSLRIGANRLPARCFSPQSCPGVRAARRSAGRSRAALGAAPRRIALHPPARGWCTGRYEVTVYLQRRSVCGPPVRNAVLTACPVSVAASTPSSTEDLNTGETHFTVR